jgi:hypothetical protein
MPVTFPIAGGAAKVRFVAIGEGPTLLLFKSALPLESVPNTAFAAEPVAGELAGIEIGDPEPEKVVGSGMVTVVPLSMIEDAAPFDPLIFTSALVGVVGMPEPLAVLFAQLTPDELYTEVCHV